MRILMLSGDPAALDAASDTGKRLEEYRSVLGSLKVLVARGTFPSFFEAYRTGKKILRRETFDVITAQGPEHWFLAWLLSRKFGVPWQLQIHTDMFNPHFVQHSMLNKIRVWLAKFLIPRANCVRAVSLRIKKSVQASSFKLQASSIFVLPIFVDAQKIRNVPVAADLHKKYGDDKFIILMASRLTKEKNIGLAIKALSSLIRANRRITLVIVGNGPERRFLELQVSSFKIQDHVKFVDAVPFETLVSYYKTCDLFLLTSDYEGYGRTLAEATATGAKIVSSDVGIAPEILEPDNIFPAGDCGALTDKLKLALAGTLKLARPIALQTKKDYLKLYKQSFELCAANKK